MVKNGLTWNLELIGQSALWFNEFDYSESTFDWVNNVQTYVKTQELPVTCGWHKTQVLKMSKNTVIQANELPYKRIRLLKK